MPRRPRTHFPGAVYHVMSRGVGGRDIFSDDADRRAFLDAIRHIRRESPFSLLAYCLMTNHFHLAVRVRQVSLSSLMQRILTRYVMKFSARHGHAGHLFQARFRSCLCEGDRYLYALLDYIHRNPVRAGLCARPDEWHWSSAARGEGEVRGLLDRRALAALDPDARAAPLEDFDPWLEPDEKTRLRLLRLEREFRPTLDEIGAALFDAESLERLRQRGKQRAIMAMKRLFAKTAVEKGHSMAAVARWAGHPPSGVRRWLAPRM